ncbi:hypothetical protein I4U23_016345 [Adineta vaga]|nr:hypothetical protein I4U23_016345 [Adineta vaga]
MKTASHKGFCWLCRKVKDTFNCRGCHKEFCLSHLQEHRGILNEQLDQLTNNHSSLRQILIELQLPAARNAPVIKHVDQWEEKCLEIIRRAAEECRQDVLKRSKEIVGELDPVVVELTAKLNQIRADNDFNEVDLAQLTKQVTQMHEYLNQTPNVYIHKHAQLVNNEIQTVSVIRREKIESKRGAWKQEGTIVAGANQQGEQEDQLSGPEGIFVDDNKNVYIADLHNHRIVRWDCAANSGTIVAGGNGQGEIVDQLNCPTDVLVDKEDQSIIVADFGNRRVMRWNGRESNDPEILIDDIDCWGLAMDNEGFLYVSDRENHEVRRWKEGESEGTLVAGGNGQGSRLIQLNYPTYLFVDDQQSVYVSDRGNHRVMKWTKGANEGLSVAGGNGKGNKLNQLSFPAGVFVDQSGQVYVADAGNGRIMLGREGERSGEIVAGGNEEGQEAHQLSGPKGLTCDTDGNLYVVDSWNARVQKFNLVLPSKFSVSS